MRADKKKNVSKVLSEAIKNPTKPKYKIAQDLWIWQWTVDRAFIEMGKNGEINKIPAIEDICNDDFEIVKLTQKETIRRLQKPKEESFSDIIRAWSESTKRYSLFKWDITDKDWGLKNIQNIEIM